MQLTPRYDDPSFLRFELPLGDPAGVMTGQRRRLTALLGELDEAQWAVASRCDGWSVQDVAAHLVSTNQFWAFSLGSALAGQPTRFLSTFDPVSSPMDLVEAVRAQSSAEVLDQLVATNDALAEAVTGLDAEGWDTIGEAPPGHVPLRAVVLHALWDCWVHERDIALPLGLTPIEDADEIAAILGYAAALGPAFGITRGTTRQGAISIDTVDPSVRVVVEVGASLLVRSGDAPEDALRLGGAAVELLEALSVRGPFPCPVPDEHCWLVTGLTEVFDQA
ncbi:MAG: maleylpyruvate isomerase N-terminal domain-containing protein [Acidimicrobiales bacterium]